MVKTYKVGTRTSPLALKQVQEVLEALRKSYSYTVLSNGGGIVPGGWYKISDEVKVNVIGISTYGDKDRATPISEIEGTDFFTKEIDEALLKGEIDGSTPLTINPEQGRRIDFAVHSAKDLPDKMNNALAIAAITPSIDPYDVLVSRFNLELDKLPHGAIIGTSSSRRKSQLKAYRDDFVIRDIRGNIEERLKLVDGSTSLTINPEQGRRVDNYKENIDAIVIAACGLVRLGLSSRITQRIPLDILTPHPLQGSLAIVARRMDLELLNFLLVLDENKIICHDK